jgi:CRISPR/Cas system-associated exonuclease Cas4 (RecB family)
MTSLTDFPWDETFQRELDSAISKDVARSGFSPDSWFRAGRGKGQGEEWWREHGAGLAKNFGEWYESTPDASVWITPDGKPAIELEIRVKFGEIPVVMYIDLILQLGSALVVVDVKTSSTEPKTLAQLGIYACGVELKYGIRPRYGTHFMCKGIGDPPVYFVQPRELDEYRYSVPYFTDQLEKLERAEQAGVYLPNPGPNCRMCGVNDACAAVGGVDAYKYRENK